MVQLSHPYMTTGKTIDLSRQTFVSKVMTLLSNTPSMFVITLLPVQFSSVQFFPVTQSCLTLSNPVDCSTPGFPVHHQDPELTQTHVH